MSQLEVLNGVPVVSADAAGSGFGVRIRSESPQQHGRSRSTKKGSYSSSSGSQMGASHSQFGISSYSTTLPPLDFSFQEIKEMSDVVSHEPNGGRKPSSTPASPSKSASNNNNFSDTASSSSSGARSKTAGQVTGVRLAYNELANLSGFDEALQLLLGPDARTQLTWLDLSFNKLTTVPDELLQYPNLSTLYLHGNPISHLSEVRKLSALPQLQKLTLHGTPLYQPRTNHGLRNPRSGVIWHLRNCVLKQLDFITITNADRRNSMRWAEQNKSFGETKKKRKPAEGEEGEGSPTRR